MWCFSNCGKYRVEPSTQEFLSLSPFSPASGYHTTCCPMPADRISYRSCGPSKETFFFSRRGGNSAFHIGPYWELMSPNHNVKRGISIPISNKCDTSGVWGARSQSGCRQEFHGVLGKMQDRLWVPGKNLLPRELASACNGAGAHPSLTDQHAWTHATSHVWAAALQTRANPPGARTARSGGLFPHGSNLKTSLSDFLRLWALLPLSRAPHLNLLNKHWTRTRKWISWRRLDPGPRNLTRLPGDRHQAKLHASDSKPALMYSHIIDHMLLSM